MKQQNFILGTIMLALASFFAKVIGAIYRIPLTNILGAEGLGLYQLVFPLYSTILVFCSTGVPNAIAKIIARNNCNAKKVLKLSLVFFSALSLVFALLLIAFAKPLSALQGNSQVWLPYVGIAPAIFLVGVLSVFRGFFQGKQNMTPTAISIIVEQVFKLLFGLFFAKLLITKDIVYGAFGAVLGVTLSELFALFVIFIEYVILKKKQKLNEECDSENITLRNLLKTALPITFSSMIMPMTLLIDSFLIVNLLKSIAYSIEEATNLYGIFTGIVNSLINLPVVVSMAVATMTIPIISKAFSKRDFVSVSKNGAQAFRMVLLIAIPSVALFAFFSNEIVYFLFKDGLKVGAINEFVVASNLLKIGSISILFIALVQISTTILQAIDHSRVPMFNMLGCCVIKVILTIILVLIPEINIYGAMISSLICYLICACFNLYSVLKHVKISLSIKYDVFLPILSSIMMIATMEFIKYSFGVSQLYILTMFLCGGIIYCFTYALMSYGTYYDKTLFTKLLAKIRR